MKTRTILTASFAALIVTACGGGSGGTNGGTTGGDEPFILDESLPNGVWNVTSVDLFVDGETITTFGGQVLITPDGEGFHNIEEYYTPLATDITAFQSRARTDSCLVNPPRPDPDNIGFSFRMSNGTWGEAPGEDESISMVLEITIFDGENDEQGTVRAVTSLEYAGAYTATSGVVLDATLCDAQQPTATFPNGIWKAINRDILHNDEPEYNTTFDAGLMITATTFDTYDAHGDDLGNGCYHRATGYEWSEWPKRIVGVTDYSFQFSGSYDGGLIGESFYGDGSPDDLSRWSYVGPVTTESSAAFHAQYQASPVCFDDHGDGRDDE